MSGVTADTPVGTKIKYLGDNIVGALFGTPELTTATVVEPPAGGDHPEFDGLAWVRDDSPEAREAEDRGEAPGGEIGERPILNPDLWEVVETPVAA